MPTLSPYPSYRKTDLPWLAQIPAYWEAKRLKFAAIINPSKTEIGHLSKNLEGSFLPMELVGEGTLTTDKTKTLEDVGQGFTYFRDGDVVVAKITPSFENGKGSIVYGLVNGIGFGTTELHVIRPSSQINKKFLYYLTISHDFRQIGAGMMQGTAGQKRVPDSFLIDYPIGYPPLAEQQAIAAYLDRQTAKIDALIAKKEHLLDLLAEQRAILISQAVTKGLNPNVKMKDSSVAWLGQVPSHWEIKPLKYVAEIQTGLTLGQKYDHVQLVSRPYLRVANVQDGYLDLDDITEVKIPIEKSLRHKLEKGDVLMTEGGDFDKLGRGYVWEEQIKDCLHQNHIFAVRPDQNYLDSYFLAALMTSSLGKNYFTSTSQQTTNLATTNSTKLKSFSVLLPPIQEQKDILAYFDKQTKRLADLMSKVETAIERLREYRAALISSVVTGKVQVKDEG